MAETKTPPKICTTVAQIEKAEKPRIHGPVGRMSYCYIWKPDENGDYRCEIIWPKTSDMSLVSALWKAARTAKFGADSKIKSPVKDGDTYVDKNGNLACEKRPELKGCWFATLHAYKQPIDVLLPNKQKIIRGTPDEGFFYAGCYAIPTLTAFGWSGKKGSGVSLVLQSLFKQKDGAPLGSRSNAEDDFAGLPAAEPDENNDPDGDTDEI